MPCTDVRPDTIRPAHGDNLRTVSDGNGGLDGVAQPPQFNRKACIGMSARYHLRGYICESRISVDEGEVVSWTKYLMVGVNVSLREKLYSGRNT